MSTTVGIVKRLNSSINYSIERCVRKSFLTRLFKNKRRRLWKQNRFIVPVCGNL